MGRLWTTFLQILYTKTGVMIRGAASVDIRMMAIGERSSVTRANIHSTNKPIPVISGDR